MFRVPDSVVVRRPITLQGVVVPAGTTLSKAQVEACGRNLNALLDSGYLVATPDPNARKDRQPQPSSLPPVVRNAMLRRGPVTDPLAVSAKAMGKQVSVSVSGGVPSFTVRIDDQEQTKSSRTFAFTVYGVGTHKVLVSDGAGGEASTNVTIIVADDEEPKKAPRKKAE